VKFGLSDWLSEFTLLFDLSLYLDRTLAQRIAERKAKSKVKVTHWAEMFLIHHRLQQVEELTNND